MEDGRGRKCVDGGDGADVDAGTEEMCENDEHVEHAPCLTPLPPHFQGRARFQYYQKLGAFVFAIVQAVGQLLYIR